MHTSSNQNQNVKIHHSFDEFVTHDYAMNACSFDSSYSCSRVLIGPSLRHDTLDHSKKAVQHAIKSRGVRILEFTQ